MRREIVIWITWTKASVVAQIYLDPYLRQPCWREPPCGFIPVSDAMKRKFFMCRPHAPRAHFRAPQAAKTAPWHFTATKHATLFGFLRCLLLQDNVNIKFMSWQVLLHIVVLTILRLWILTSAPYFHYDWSRETTLTFGLGTPSDEPPYPKSPSFRISISLSDVILVVCLGILRGIGSTGLFWGNKWSGADGKLFALNWGPWIRQHLESRIIVQVDGWANHAIHKGMWSQDGQLRCAYCPSNHHVWWPTEKGHMNRTSKTLYSVV